MRNGTDFFVDVKNPAVGPDVEGPARRKRLILVDDAIRRGDLFARIAQQRIIDTERLRERLVGFRGIDANRKMRDVERADGIATLTE